MKKDIVDFAKAFYDLNDDLHGWGHIERVWSRCRQILAKIRWGEKINKNLLEIAVYLHDIGRNPPSSEKFHSENHAAVSAILTTKFLEAKNTDSDLITALSRIIRAHSFSLGEPADTLEAQILSDADKLDALGAVGIYRVCAFQTLHGGNIESILSHCDEKLLKLEKKLYLPVSQELARPLTDRIKNFKEQIEEELRLNESMV